jgi:hypothetical protein
MPEGEGGIVTMLCVLRYTRCIHLALHLYVSVVVVHCLLLHCSVRRYYYRSIVECTSNQLELVRCITTAVPIPCSNFKLLGLSIVWRAVHKATLYLLAR